MRPIVSRPLRNNSNSNGVHHAQPYPPSLLVKIQGGDGGKVGFSIMFVHLGRKFYRMLSVGGNASQPPQVDYTAAGPHALAVPVLCTLGRHFPVGEPRELRGPAQ